MTAVELESPQKIFYLTMNHNNESIRTLPAFPFITRSMSDESPLKETLKLKPLALHPAGSPYGHCNGDIRHRDENGHVVLNQFDCAMCYKYACPKCGSRSNRMFMSKCYNCDYQMLPEVKNTPEVTCEMKLQDPCTTCSQPQKWLKSKQTLIMLAQARLRTNSQLSIHEVWQQIIREQCVNRDIQILKHEYDELYYMFTRNIQIAKYLAAKEYQPDKK